ncbi:GlxA family transcriptional regulator [Mycobacteroides chelonae]|uniref:GlxA family transcriptional regulator n=1 Tax=Mycobacteroides chelonae TaxID=1774 RepID=UPI0008A96405|nr:DJ-1/PfpI family protein [Mycobacteroides chelonae]AYM45011.1 helix-turn-helix domain-containing protein [[Mycobacterium] chelonae subsp. gwanakae]OHU15597.1 AraC family transcriptional regulator [Mycobacteroides chelonae]OHU33033.1 AraC family transcriptional regulator [Mycobacteroides chelonae]
MSDERLITIVVFDGMKLLDLAGPAEVFAEANRFGANYRLVVASVDGQDVATSIGSPFSVTATIDSIESTDTVLVAGGDVLVGRPVDPALVDSLARISARCRRIASICTGAFLLAQAGVLDHRRATTHWRHTGLLQRAFPNITVEPDAIFVRDAHVYTSAGVSAGIDLALALVEDDYGSDIVREVARSLVVYLKRAGGQSQFSVFVESAPPAGSALRPVTDAIAADPAGDHSVNKLAARAALSTRQLTRLFHTELSTTPARYVELARIDAARGALDAGSTVAEAARIAGFGSPETLRRVFVSELGVSPKAYRDRFRTAAR